MKPDIDLFDPDRYVPGVPNDMFAWLRRNDPVYFQKEPQIPFHGRGYWAITRHADVVMMSRDPATYSSNWGTQLMDYDDEADIAGIRAMLLNMDPPQHVKYRNLVSRGFIPRLVRELGPRIKRRVDAILDGIAERGECDFVAEAAAILPLEVIAEMMGIPDEDRPKVFEWTNSLISYNDPELAASFEDVRNAAMCIWQYAGELAEKRAGGDGTDLVSVLVRSQVDGEKLSYMELISFFLLLAVAGNETTRNATSGGMLALIEHPEERARLVANPALIAPAVEEIVRWTTPVVYMRRQATRDVVVRGKTIKEGDKIALYYSSANRDEDVFAEPERFDVGRTPNDHIGYGIGQHVCLGASLARLELQIMFSELMRRFPDMELAEPVRRLRSNFINGVKEMRVSYTPEKALLRVAR